MTAHTKGPWHLRAHGKMGWSIESNHMAPAIGNVDNLRADDGGYETAEHNARLIALSPEFLETLEGIVDAVDFDRGAGKDSEDRERAKQLLIKTRDLIAKAKGEA